MPNRTLRFLNVENSGPDADLLKRHLSAAGYDLITERVDTPAAMKAALEAREWDIILCDYSMLNFNALAALTILRTSGLDIPFIIISGTIGEDVAIEAMLAGANDYLPKDNLTRLVPAIERELQQAENRRVQRETEEALKASEAELRALFEAMSDEIFVFDSEGRHLKVAPTHPAYSKSLGVNRIGKTVHEVFPAEVADFMLGNIRRALDEGRKLNVEYILSINGKDLWFDGTVLPMSDDSVVWVARDITERKRTENERRIISEVIQAAVTTPNLDEFLKLVHRLISQVIYAGNCFVMLHDPVSDLIHYEFWVDKYDSPPPPHLASKGFSGYVLRTSQPLLLTEELRKRMCEQGDAEQIGRPSPSWLGVPLLTPSRTIGVLVLQHYEDEHAYSERDLEFLSSIGDQLALAIERKRTEEGLRESESLLAASQRITHLGSWVVDLTGSDDLDENQVHWSDEHYRIFGFEPGQVEVSSETFYNSVHPDDRTRVGEELREAIKQRRPYDIEHRIILPDGCERIVQGRAEMVLDNNTGKPIKLLGSVQDITERKQAEKVLRESEESYRELVENAIDMIYTQDLDGNYTSINRAAERITGYTKEETLTRNLAHSVAPEQREKIAAQMKAAILSGTDATAYELEIVAKDGHRVAVEVNTRIIHENGVPVGVQGIARDITERKRVEESLREAEEKYRNIFENAVDGIFRTTADGRFITANPAMASMLGYDSPEELIQAQSDGDKPNCLDPQRREEFTRLLDEHDLISGFEYQARRKDGSSIWLSDGVRAARDESGKLLYYEGFTKDITDRKLADGELQLAQRRVEDIVHSVDGIVWEADAKTFTFTFVSKQAEQILGYPIQRWLDEPTFWPDHIHPDDREAALKFCVDSTKSLAPHQFEYRMLAQDGREVWLSDIVTVVAEAGRPVKLRGIMTDITERKRSDDELRESEEKYRTILENIEDGYFEVDVAGNFTFFNDSLCGIFGYPRDEMSGMNNREYMDDQNARKIYQTFNEVYRTGKPATAFDWETIRKDGTGRFIEASVSRREDSTGQPIGFRGIVRDITERKRTDEALRLSEEQLQQSGKMEAIGLLAGGIAHDFNNLLTAITGYSELTLRRLGADDPLRQNIEEIKGAGDRAAALTGQLLAFSRKQVLKPIVHNVNSVISNIEKMLRRIIRESIELITVLDPELGNIKADPGQVEQVIMNLAVNARDAMQDGGTLTIETQNVFLDDDFVRHHIAVSTGSYVRITVSDTGEGMDEQTQSRIFEPFFTTKEVGKGTGLGLSTVHGIIKQSGGDIMVYSEPGHGTAFKIYLPCVDEIAQKPRWAGSSGEDYSGTETILLVEDEEIVRNLVREILTGNGYQVLEASSGKAALAVCAANPEPIHMLLTDVIMPNMSGPVLKGQVVTLRPDIKTLFMSGYTDDSIASSGILDSDAAFIEKPFTPDGLARKVREVLES